MINHKRSVLSTYSLGKMVSLLPKKCTIKKSVRCVLNVHPHSQTTTATTKRGKWSKRDWNGDLCTSCRKPGPFNILVAALQEADAYLLMKPLCSYEVFHFSQRLYDFKKKNFWLKQSKLERYIKRNEKMKLRLPFSTARKVDPH